MRINRVHASCGQKTESATKRESGRQLMPPSPSFSPESPKKAGDSGERSEPGGSVTQGGARGSCLALALGYKSSAPLGLLRKKRLPAASQMSNSSS